MAFGCSGSAALVMDAPSPPDAGACVGAVAVVLEKTCGPDCMCRDGGRISLAMEAGTTSADVDCRAFVGGEQEIIVPLPIGATPGTAILQFDAYGQGTRDLAGRGTILVTETSACTPARLRVCYVAADLVGDAGVVESACPAPDAG
jgi:hypothetical protein